MEFLQRLKEIKAKYREPRDKEFDLGWLSRHVYANLSLPFIQFLLKTNVTPNQVTIVGMLLGLSGCLLFMANKYWLSVAAAVILNLCYLSDYIDGALARAKNMTSFKGVYLESVVYIIICPLLFLGLGVGSYLRFNQPALLILSFTASVGYLVNRYLYDALFLAFVVGKEEKAVRSLDCFKNPSAHSEGNSPTGGPFIGDGLPESKRTPFPRARQPYFFLKSLLIKLDIFWNPFYIIILVTLTTILDMNYLAIIFYGITYPVIAIKTYLRQLKEEPSSP